MATVKADLKDVHGVNLVADVQFTRSGVAAKGGSAAETLSLGGRSISAAALRSTGIVLTAGTYLVLWPDGPHISRVLINVPTGTGTHDIWDLVNPAGPQATLQTVYYGPSALETLAEAGILGLASSTTKSTRAGTYAFAGGGYKFLAWPDALGSPVAVSGFRDPNTGFNVSMAGAPEGFDQISNGWSYRLVPVSGKVYRLYRTRQKLGGANSILVT